MDRFGESLGLVLHVAAFVVLALAYREFWAKVRRGALYKAAAVLLAGWAIGILLSWALVETFPRTLASDDRLFYVVEPGSRIRGRRSSARSRAGRTSSSTHSSGCSARWR